MNSIIVEAIIGGGKTTLVENLGRRLNERGVKAHAYFEPVEKNPYLDLYYKDRQRYALTMQFFLMAQRYAEHQDGIEKIWKNFETCIYDRSIYGDWVFAEINHLDGNMSDLEYMVYNKMKDVMWKSLLMPHCVLFLDCAPETAMQRIVGRARKEEMTDISDKPCIEMSYLKGLQEGYERLMVWFEQQGVRVVRLPWNHHQDGLNNETLDEIIEKLAQHCVFTGLK